MPLEGDSKIFAKLTLICRLRTDQEQRQQEQPEQQQRMQPFFMVRCAGRRRIAVGGGQEQGHTQTRAEEKQSDCKSAIYKYLKIP